ncbi:MAG: hypothetical protein WEB19_01005 [Acidimicrobiia bacterium]
MTIPLNGQPSFTFTQLAGEAVELIATVDADPGTSTFCGVNTIVYGDGIPLGARVDLFTNKGELGEGSDIGGLAAPASDRTVTLRAFTRELDGCDQEPPELEGDGPDTWTVSVTVTVVTLRN